MCKKSVTSLLTIILLIKSCITLLKLSTPNIKSIIPGDETFDTSVQQITYSYSPLLANKLGPSRPLLGKLNSGQETSSVHHALRHPDSFTLSKEVSSNTKRTEQANSHISNGKQQDSLQTSPIPNRSSKTTQNTSGLMEYTTSKTSNDYLEMTGADTITTTTECFEKSSNASTIISEFEHFKEVLNQLERNFYRVTFNKLLSVSPKERKWNGISFAQSGLFLYLALVALCTETQPYIQMEIKESIHLKTSCSGQIQFLQKIISSLPISGNFTKFRLSSRLVLGPHLKVGDDFHIKTARDLKVHLDKLDNTEDPEKLTKYINQMVEIDSGGAMHDTFDEDELADGVCAIWLTTLYLRARWRSAPTVLNGYRPFYDGDAPERSVRMIRINDIMKYADLPEWDAEGIVVRYADPELSLLLLVPRNRSLKNLANWISSHSLHYVYAKMQTRRIAVTLPIYTLRMNLLLPGKLDMMGISRLVDVNMKEGTGCDSLKLSHAVQRIMFWAEAGRSAFKDDGLEWDDPPEFERILDRPYIYFVRWRNLTLLNGNFVL